MTLDTLQPDHLRSGPPVRHRMFANEPALGPSPRAVAAARAALELVGSYPDELAGTLRSALADSAAVDPSEVLVGNGSTAVIGALVEDAVASGRPVVSFAGSFAFYRSATERLDGHHVEVGSPSGPRDVERLAAALGRQPALVIVDDPGSPTGARLPDGALRWLSEHLPGGTTLLVDEAYHEFVGTDLRAPAHHELERTPELVVTRTFSKALGIPGLRVGYALADADRVTRLRPQRDRTQLTSPSLAGATAALSDHGHTATNVAAAVEGRERVRGELAALGIEVPASNTNYVLVPTRAQADEVVQQLTSRDVGVRDMTPYGLDHAVRVSIGPPGSVDAFLEAVVSVPGLVT